MNQILPYLLYFIPLLSSILMHFLDGKRFLSNISYLILILITIISMRLLSTLGNDIIIVNSTKNFNIIGTEYRIGGFNVFFLVSILFVNFIGFMNYINNLILTRRKTISYIKHFFSIYFLYIFSIVGIILTDNIFHLFVFLEIYSFSTYIIVTNYKDKNLTILSYKYFSNNIFGSMLNMLSVFYMIVYFNTNSILSINQQLMTISLHEHYDIFLIFLLFLFSLVIRFFNNSISKYHDTNYTSINFISISNMFINTLIGVFILSNLVFNILPTDKVFSMFFIDKIVIILSGIAIIYNSVLLFKKEYNNSIFNIFIRLNLINLFYIIMIIFLDSDIKTILNYIVDFLSVNLLLYFFSDFLSLKYKTNNIGILNKDKFLKIFFIFVLLYKLYLPIGAGASINNSFILNAIKNREYYLFLPFLINKAAIAFTIFNIIKNKEDVEVSDIKDNTKLITIITSIFLIFIFTLFFNIF